MFNVLLENLSEFLIVHNKYDYLCTASTARLARPTIIWNAFSFDGRDWEQEEKGTTEDEMASPTQWTWVWVDSVGW